MHNTIQFQKNLFCYIIDIIQQTKPTEFTKYTILTIFNIKIKLYRMKYYTFAALTTFN